MANLVCIEGAFFESLLQVHSFDEFENDEGTVLVVINVVGTHHIGVTDFGDGSHFREVVGFGRSALDGGLVEALECDVAIELGVESAENIGRGARADF